MKKMTKRDFKEAITKHAKLYFKINLSKYQLKILVHVHFGGKWILILGPRRHGKSVAVNQIYLSWRICNDPELRILIVSHKDKRAKDFSRKLMAVIERSQQMQDDYGISPEKKRWGVTEWVIHSERKTGVIEYPTVETLGIGGGVSGGSFDIIIFEDLCTKLNSISEEKDRLYAFLEDVFYTQDAGLKEKTIFIGTRQHVHDYYSELLKNPDYNCLVNKAIQDDGTALWPERWSLERLETEKRARPRGFSFQWQQEPLPEEGSAFKREWLKAVWYQNLPTEKNLDYYIGMDTGSGSVEKRSSWFAYCVVAVDTAHDDLIYVVEHQRYKYTIEECKAKMREVYWRYQDGHNLVQCMIEAPLLYAKLYEDVISELPKARKYSPVHDELGGQIQKDKIMRIETVLAPLFERGEIKMLPENLNEWTKDFIESEYLLFPKGDFDMLDALVYAVADAKNRPVLDYVPFRFFGRRRTRVG